jgi:hypothetical protein
MTSGKNPWPLKQSTIYGSLQIDVGVVNISVTSDPNCCPAVHQHFLDHSESFKRFALREREKISVLAAKWSLLRSDEQQTTALYAPFDNPSPLLRDEHESRSIRG